MVDMSEYAVRYTVHGIMQYAKCWAFSPEMAVQDAIRRARYTLSVTALDVVIDNVKEIK